MKVLVTGGAGFIGGHFVRAVLEERPWNVIAYDSLTYAANLSSLPLGHERLELVQRDIRDYESLMLSAIGCSQIIHFAAESHNDNSLQNPELFFEVNLLGTLNVARVATELGIRLHHVSTDEVFGDLPLDGNLRFNEHSPYRPSSPYSASKAAADHLVRSWGRSFGLQANISNCSNNYGFFQNSEKFIPRQILRLLQGEAPQLYGSGENIRDWIAVEDHVSGVLAAIEAPAIGQTYLFGASNPRSNLSIARRLNELFGRKRDDIEFIGDRPGHDLRYEIDASSSQSRLNWTPKHHDVLAELPRLVSHFEALN